MKGVFDYRDLGQAAPSQDTELTLSPTSLLFIFFGLVLLCGLCFGLGYATGHRTTQDNSETLPPDSNGQQFPETENTHAKPSGNTTPSTAAAPTPSAVTDTQDVAGASTAGASLQSAAVAAAGGSSAGSPQVKPAFGSAAPVLAGQPVTSTVAPAMGSGPAAAGALMVQIAAVSQPEDSDVLVNALRKRGYAVFARREPLDGLIHVKIGPFKTADEADKRRQKLLNDGYNAIVQQ